MTGSGSIRRSGLVYLAAECAEDKALVPHGRLLRGTVVPLEASAALFTTVARRMKERQPSLLAEALKTFADAELMGSGQLQVRA